MATAPWAGVGVELGRAGEVGRGGFAEPAPCQIRGDQGHLTKKTKKTTQTIRGDSGHLFGSWPMQRLPNLPMDRNLA